MEGSKFTILGAARTGSHMLCSFLESHPEILCHDEVFNMDEVYFAREIGDDPFIGGKVERDADSLSFLEKLWVNKGNHTSVGFKMIYPKHDGPVMLDVLRYIDEDLAANHYVSQLKVDSVKLNPRPLAKRIANYEELLQELKGTRYEKELLS